MSEISLKLLQNLALAERDRQVACQYLDGEDEAILEKASKPPVSAATNSGTWNFSLWGSLAPETVVNSFANSSIISWALRCVGDYSTVPEIGSALQKKCVFVDSQVMSNELDRFEKEPKYTPNEKFMKRINLVAMRERLTRCSAATLDKVPRLDYVAVVLHSKKAHWSLLVFSCAEKSVAHYDSLYGMHEDLAKATYRLLVALNFIPHGTLFLQRLVPAQQRGGWECGYAAIATALFLSDTLTKIFPSVTDFREVVENSDRLRYMIGYLLQRSHEAREVNKYFEQRLEKIYTDE